MLCPKDGGTTFFFWQFETRSHLSVDQHSWSMVFTRSELNRFVCQDRVFFFLRYSSHCVSMELQNGTLITNAYKFLLSVMMGRKIRNRKFWRSKSKKKMKKKKRNSKKLHQNSDTKLQHCNDLWRSVDREKVTTGAYPALHEQSDG